MTRVLMVSDGDRWFVRECAWVHQDDTACEIVYHCTAHVAGPLSFEDAAAAAKAHYDMIAETN